MTGRFSIVGARARRLPLAVAAAAVLLTIAASTETFAAADAVLYRVFLRDGSTLVSYGDYARVGDRVVLSVPIGEGDQPQLQLVTITEASVDWQLTDRYAEAARAHRYANTRGEDDFNLLSGEVAKALNEVALTNDPARRVALADTARQLLADWPAAHFGYRASDVAQLSTLLDEVVSELRVAAGQSRFDLRLVAPTVTAPTMEVMPPPSLRESIEVAFTAARVAAEPGERVSMLESIVRTLSATPGGDPPTDPAGATKTDWVSLALTRASAELAAERQVDRIYAQLAKQTLSQAADRARRADVRGLDALIRSVLKTDARLGRARPTEIAALLVAIDAQKSAAQRLRLARDAWSLRAGVVADYRRQLGPTLERLTRLKRWLEDVRELAGPSPAAVSQLEERATVAGRELALMKPPAGLEGAHGMLNTASGLAARAASARRRAVASGDMPAAWEASSAASGALMMLERAGEELKRMAERPQLK
jgi:hypothetical protein